MFTSPMGAPMRHSNFRRRVWLPPSLKVGRSGVHFHDLRHTGNTLTADEGANLRELMDRMGHSSTRAALIYLHSSNARQRAIPRMQSAGEPKPTWARAHLARKAARRRKRAS